MLAGLELEGVAMVLMLWKEECARGSSGASELCRRLMNSLFAFVIVERSEGAFRGVIVLGEGKSRARDALIELAVASGADCRNKALQKSPIRPNQTTWGRVAADADQRFCSSRWRVRRSRYVCRLN